MKITKEQAKQMLANLDRIVASNPHHVLISRAYASYIQKAADSLERRIARGDFDEVSQ